MNETLTLAPATYPKITRITGHDVLTDPGAVQMRRYLPVLAVVAAPYAGMGGDHDPLIRSTAPLNGARCCVWSIP